MSSRLAVNQVGVDHSRGARMLEPLKVVSMHAKGRSLGAFAIARSSCKSGPQGRPPRSNHSTAGRCDAGSQIHVDEEFGHVEGGCRGVY